jgi:formamidopyrimidine-DNA glycosylase
VPELLEIEYYRRLAEGALGRPVAGVAVPDPHCLRPPLGPRSLGRLLAGRAFLAARRRGKLLILDTEGPRLGMRFGMTGGLVLDHRAAIERLRYSAGRADDRWVRLRVRFTDGGELAFHDPRRFGRVEVDPDESALGPDALSVGRAGLERALSTRGGQAGPPLKARLMDQRHLAGIGNLLADEILWRASLSPSRPCGSLSEAERRSLHRHLGATLGELLERGGSHLGDLMDERRPGGRCPRDGAPLARATVGGRTTYWCPAHQR